MARVFLVLAAATVLVAVASANPFFLGGKKGGGGNGGGSSYGAPAKPSYNAPSSGKKTNTLWYGGNSGQTKCIEFFCEV
jgi:hypothetical protein